VFSPARTTEENVVGSCRIFHVDLQSNGMNATGTGSTSCGAGDSLRFQKASQRKILMLLQKLSCESQSTANNKKSTLHTLQAYLTYL
ncbi:hypothetical protein V5799_029452, partial [Amblyomma americanum]